MKKKNPYNKRMVILGDRYWDKLKEMKIKEERSISEIVREALIDLFEKRRREQLTKYDPVSDSFKHSR